MLFRNCCRLLEPLRCSSRLQNVRFFAKIEDGLPDDRDTPNQVTHVNMLSSEDDGCLYIHEYSNVGFTLRSGVKIFGPTVFFPRSFISWKVNSAHDICDKSLTLFNMIHPKLDLLVIGKGDGTEEINPNVIAYLRKCKLNFEILKSEQAMSTFNFLNKEQRWVAAAIIPPQFIFTQTQNDIKEYFAEKKREANLIIDDDEVEQIEEQKKEIETNAFGYPIIRSPLESSVSDHWFDPSIPVNQAKSKRKFIQKVKTPEKPENDDPWAEEDDNKSPDKSSDKSSDKKDK